MNKKEFDQSYERMLRAVGLAVLAIEGAAQPNGASGRVLYDIRTKLDADNGTSVLAVLKARRGEDGLVGFVGGLSLHEVLLAVAKKLRKDAVKWREDRPWEAPGS